MILQRIRMQNFRQHANSTIEFRHGLTGIIGPNGSGKSTILEAIAWAIYGSRAARGSNDTIRFLRAAPKAKVVVELVFELDQHEYKIVRTLNTAEVYLDNSLNPVANGVGNVTGFLQGKLGMTREEFFNTYFTQQKDLQFLAHMGPAERGRFLAQVLGYERLRRAQQIGRDKRRDIDSTLKGLQAGLPDPTALDAELKTAAERLKDAKKNVVRADKAREKAEKDLAAETPAWQKAQQDRESARSLTLQLESGRRELQNAERELERATAALAKIAEAEQQLAALKPLLAELDALVAADEKMDELARAHASRTALQQNEGRLVAEIAKLDVALEGLKQAPALLKKAQEELADLKKQLPDIAAQREKLLNEWQQELAENRAALRTARDHEKELVDQLGRLEKAGEDGKCPICTKPLGNEYGTVREHLELELEDQRNAIRWRTSREKQLSTRPAALVEAEQVLTQAQTAIERKTEREAKCAEGVKDLWERTEERQAKEKQLAELRAQIGAIPDGYDEAEHARVRTRVTELRQLSRQAGIFEHEIAARGAREQELEAARQRHGATAESVAQFEKQLVTLKFDEKAYLAQKEKYEKLLAHSHAATVTAAQEAEAMRGAEEALFTARRALTAYQEKREQLVALESALKHHTAMDDVLTRLRTELNARVRPELSELASAFLVDITDGRYNALDIDEDYNILVLEDGEEKPVISGGEEDVANLVLRIAISQMIAERAGQHLSVLFLDEVFGSLDIERRDNVIQLLQKLHDRFEQVVIITHVETIREGLDHVVRLEYNEASGATLVKDETEEPAELALL